MTRDKIRLKILLGEVTMKQKQNFLTTVCNLAIPVALQSMLQSSFSIVDQIMIGQLGSVSVAGVGLAGKFSSIFSVERSRKLKKPITPLFFMFLFFASLHSSGNILNKFSKNY